jgi:hypothetical protein
MNSKEEYVTYHLPKNIPNVSQKRITKRICCPTQLKSLEVAQLIQDALSLFTGCLSGLSLELFLTKAIHHVLYYLLFAKSSLSLALSRLIL